MQDIKEEELVSLLATLVGINSTYPNESQLCNYLYNLLL